MAKSDNTAGSNGNGGGDTPRKRAPRTRKAEEGTNGTTGAGATAKKTGGRKTAAGKAPAASAEAAGGGVSQRGRARDTAETPKKRGGGGGARKTAGGGPDLRTELREFASRHPQGWGHDEWLGLLGHLAGRGHDVSDPNRVGMALERERLASTLEGVQGMGGRRVEAVADRYQTLWSLRHADVEELAGLPGMNRALAERVKQQVG